MKKNVKKGFTLVELLVVIAIIAILATVSVVGYLSFTKKANISNDVTMTTQMNTILQAEEASSEIVWPSEANDLLKEAGIDLSKLDAYTDGYKYVWDKATNRILLLDETNNVVAPEGATDASKEDTFIFVSNQGELTAAAGFGVAIVDSFADNIEVKASKYIDVLHETAHITLTTLSEFEVKTNGGSLTIDAAAATVNHYGNAGLVNVKNVANNSYHTYATVNTINVYNGRVVLEATAKVDLLNVVAVENQNVVLVKNDDATINTVTKEDGANVSSAEGIEVETSVTATNAEELIAALNGDVEVIYLKSEEEFVFDSSLNISRTVTIIGEGSEKTKISTSKALVTFINVVSGQTSVDFKLIGVEVSGLVNNQHNNESGILFGSSDKAFNGNISIVNCNFSNFTKNSITFKGGNATVTNNDIYCKGFDGAAGNGIQVDMGAKAEIADNYIYGYQSQAEKWSATGILVLGDGNAKIYNNALVNCENSIVVNTIYRGEENTTLFEESNNDFENSPKPRCEYKNKSNELVVSAGLSVNEYAYYYEKDSKGYEVVRYALFGNGGYATLEEAKKVATDAIDRIVVVDGDGNITETLNKTSNGWN